MSQNILRNDIEELDKVLAESNDFSQIELNTKQFKEKLKPKNGKLQV